MKKGFGTPLLTIIVVFLIPAILFALNYFGLI